MCFVVIGKSIKSTQPQNTHLFIIDISFVKDWIEHMMTVIQHATDFSPTVKGILMLMDDPYHVVILEG